MQENLKRILKLQILANEVCLYINLQLTSMQKSWEWSIFVVQYLEMIQYSGFKPRLASMVARCKSCTYSPNRPVCTSPNGLQLTHDEFIVQLGQPHFSLVCLQCHWSPLLAMPCCWRQDLLPMALPMAKSRLWICSAATFFFAWHSVNLGSLPTILFFFD